MGVATMEQSTDDNDCTDSDSRVGVGQDMERLGEDELDHLTMSVTVSTKGLDGKDIEVLSELATLYENAFEEVVAKNKDYSWSFLSTGAKLATGSNGPFDTPVRSQAYGLLTRTGDKRERLLENIYGNGDPSVSDPAWQTAVEAANYYFFLAFILQNPDLALEATSQ